MRKIQGLATFIIAVGLLLSTNSYGNQENALAVAVPPAGYPPYIIVDENQVSGIVIDPLKLAARAHKIQLVFHYFPEKRAARLIEQGQIDMRMESPAWVSNPEHYLWSNTIIQLSDIIIHNKRETSDFSSNAHLKDTEIATHLGYGYPTIEHLFTSGHSARKDYSSELEMLNAVANLRPSVNRVTVMNPQVAEWVLKDKPEIRSKLTFSKRVIDTAPLKFQIAKSDKNQRLLKLINKELKKLQDENQLEAIANRILKGKN